MVVLVAAVGDVLADADVVVAPGDGVGLEGEPEQVPAEGEEVGLLAEVDAEGLVGGVDAEVLEVVGLGEGLLGILPGRLVVGAERLVDMAAEVHHGAVGDAPLRVAVFEAVGAAFEGELRGDGEGEEAREGERGEGKSGGGAHGGKSRMAE